MNVLELGSLTRWSEIRKKNRLIDEGVHLNRQTVDLARDEIGRRGNEFIGDIQQGAEKFGDIVRKVSKRSMRSKRSHESDLDEAPRIELEDIGPLGPPGSGLEHHHTAIPREVYVERECVMGQTLLEEAEVSSVGGESDDDVEWHHLQDHSSHMTSKVQPYSSLNQDPSNRGFGTGDHAVNMGSSRAEHTSHMEPKIRPADANSPDHRKQHGSHKGSKVRSAGVKHAAKDREHGSHMSGSKVKPADESFEDIELGGKDNRRDSKTLKQD
ncbi:uncharacterized protein GGS25DRAFT_364810 [Hypoxylon fragiforme]|uniref:uncharacterized protein n=1 Tax=Hypoxylon fragiforme TaxID=63214 RepID=UPI0020C6E2B7|nr:uncharacterized protein GGS25DRAFT_364810 [Hypoxylon fragiforme]KAI2605953.1 hypothetical protein GGS25DRAFT_364810 [Hypoxylon fragiforme]